MLIDVGPFWTILIIGVFLALCATPVVLLVLAARNPVPIRKPPIPAMPNEISFNRQGRDIKKVVHEIYVHARWIGEHNLDAELRTPNDGTVRYRFVDLKQAIFFKLRWGE